MKGIWTENLRFWIIPTVLFSIFVAVGAMAHPLWGDEAETALFARNILKYGVPKGWDGVNIMGINNAVVLNKHLINHTSPWAQYYLVASSFALFGESSFTARLPSIILSILTLPLVFALALRISGHRSVAILAVWILALSVPFILFAYQARYYSLQTISAVLFALSCFGITRPGIRYKLLFFFAGVVLFYANYVAFFAFWLASLIVFGVAFGGRFIKTFAIVSLGLLAVTLPWYLWLRPATGRGSFVLYSLSDSLYGMFVYLRAAFYPYNDNNAFPILFLPILLFIGRKRRWLLFPFALAAVHLIIKAILTLSTHVDTTFVHARYTMLTFPFFVIATAIVIDAVRRWRPWVGYAVLALYVSTNIFSLNTFRTYPIAFFGEVTDPYPTPDREVADYLQKHAKDGDTAWVNLDRDHEPLIFHLKDKIRFVNRVSLINTRIFPQNRHIIPRYIYDFRDNPDWVIMFSKRIPDPLDFLTFDGRPMPGHINLARDYEEIVLPVFFADMSRPELELRSFTKIDPAPADRIFIYKKK